MTAATHSGEPVPGLAEPRTEKARQSEVDFDDSSLEFRRLFSEVWGTFLLVLVAAGGGVIGRPARRWRPDPGHEGPGAGHDGDGDHLLHGHDLGGASQPGGHARLRGPRQLPLAAGPGYIIAQIVGAILAPSS